MQAERRKTLRDEADNAEAMSRDKKQRKAFQSTQRTLWTSVEAWRITMKKTLSIAKKRCICQKLKDVDDSNALCTELWECSGKGLCPYNTGPGFTTRVTNPSQLGLSWLS